MQKGFEKFSENARNSLLDAERIAKDSGYKEVDDSHLLLSIVKNSECVAGVILKEFSVTPSKVQLVMDFLANSQGPEQRVLSQMVSEPTISKDLKEIVIFATQISESVGSTYIGTEHLLAAMIDFPRSRTREILKQLKVDLQSVKIFLKEKIIHSRLEKIDSFSQEDKKKVKNQLRSKKIVGSFTTDLTELALRGALDPVIGREKEIDRMITILNRRIKNNPILVGDPGVGKTAIVEGLAQRIASGNVPPFLLGKRVLMVDLTLLVAGTKYRGEFEERIKGLVNEVVNDGNIILFIDEVHTIIGTGSAEGSLDAANILKPSLARGALRLIGATTFDEFKKKIEKDPALERRFQKIIVEEPTVEETIEILKGLRERFESHHRVKIEESAIIASAELAERYITEKKLPDKAIDLLDESASSLSIKYTTIPDDIRSLEIEIEKAVQEKERFVKSENFEKAAEAKERESKLVSEHKRLLDQRFGKRKSNWPRLTSEIVARTVSSATGIPEERLDFSYNAKSSKKSRISLFERLKKRIIGQDEAIREVAKVVTRAEAKLSDPKRPLGVFIFLGPTGVGKTETAKALAEEVFSRKDALIQVDMSEFGEKFNVSKLIGSPAGYVGFEEGGNLTEEVRKKPYSVVLFDEIEKAHPDVLNLLLQVFDEGIVTDAQGKKINFRNTIIIMTSNIASSDISQKGIIGFKSQKGENSEFEKIKEVSLRRLKENLAPEFLNRISKVVVFKPLSKDDLTEITKNLLDTLKVSLEKQGIGFRVSNDVIKKIVDDSFEEGLGARPIRRRIDDLISDKVSEMIVGGLLKSDDSVNVFIKDGEVFVVAKKRDNLRKREKVLMS